MTNRLDGETSAYLRQHADNPVEWYPWGEEALLAAVERDVPILLSVGYSACHWCHVMAHESFENEEIAAMMNASFVNIKVDREERPDIDALYMEAVQAMAGRGGWPMTVIMTPDGQPFFAGTYFPPTPQRGMPGFGDLLDSLSDAWENRRDDIAEFAANVTDALVKAAELDGSSSSPDPHVVAHACDLLVRSHDPVNGGFGAAPKFPSPLGLDVLLRHHLASGDPEALQVVQLTLDRMAAGGIYDHLGGGFARYSVDDHWAVPHFEKMLYDNALLVPAYLHGWQVTGSEDYRQVVVETIEYVLRDLRLPGAGIASAEDADSEGEEGLFYVWSFDDLVELLRPAEIQLVAEWYGVSAGGNFDGANVLHRREPGSLLRSPEVEALREKLFGLRERRIRPGLDDKVLVEWNALMISSLAEAGAAVGEPHWVNAAVEVMTFLEANLVDSAGRWYRSWQADGGRRHLAYAADYAALVDAYTRLGEATGQRRWHESSLQVAESMLELFWDEDSAGLFSTGTDAEELLVRRKEVVDSPIPSANSNAAFALLRLAAIHGRRDLADHADQMIRLASEDMGTQPMAYSRLLAAFDLAAGNMFEVVISGDRTDLLDAARASYLPNGVVLHGEPFHSPAWEGRTGDRAYVCQNYTCQLPAEDVDSFVSQISQGYST